MGARASIESAPIWIEIAMPDVRKRFAGFVTVARGKTADTETATHLRAIAAALEAARS